MNPETQHISIRDDDIVWSLWKHRASLKNLEMMLRVISNINGSWAFAEVKKMEGNAKIIKFIARDENLHLAGTQTLLKLLPKDDPDFAAIAESPTIRDECIKMFVDAVNQEKAWAHYLFKDGSMIGLNEQLLCDYIEFIAHKRMTAVGLPCPYKSTSNPLPWTQKWIAGAEVQVAPQEVELSSYTIGGTKQDVDQNSFAGFKL